FLLLRAVLPYTLVPKIYINLYNHTDDLDIRMIRSWKQVLVEPVEQLYTQLLYAITVSSHNRKFEKQVGPRLP
ncbi:hypothetical protein ABET14_14190, partial [Heyndrickxia coagulans]|uniref:hypothetical protein n=1 Tax=Heyndrickxia coagulans TaxID=1398 RepID=UPI003D1CDFFB